jgi:hypothetical protein
MMLMSMPEEVATIKARGLALPPQKAYGDD